MQFYPHTAGLSGGFWRAPVGRVFQGRMTASGPNQSSRHYFKMRWILAAVVTTMLTGCPAATRLYVHNQSMESLVYTGWWKPGDPTTIRANHKAWVPVRSGQDDCVEFIVDGQKRGYIVGIDAQMMGDRTRYGSRINTIYRDGHLTVHGRTGATLNLKTREGCDYDK